MEKMPMMGGTPEDNGRRNFLRKIATIAGGLALSSSGLDSFAAGDGSLKESNIEIFVKNQIEKSKDIINNKKYE
ncbi:MAG: hypothetical protein WCW65_03060, partial [Candidatus Paceibacterota bacterium]